MLRAIYHPYYVPDKDWYKTQLLLWDEIYRIVPFSVDREFGQSRLSELWEIPEEFVKSRDIEMYDYQYFQERAKSIKNQLKNLAKGANRNFKEDPHIYLNYAKVPEWLAATLKKYGLRRKKSRKFWGAKHYEVQEDAGDFLMSCIAHRMSLHYGLSPLTDKQANCFITFGNQIGKVAQHQPAGESMKSFVCGVVDIMVPGDVNKLTFRQVIDLRAEYDNLRQSAAKLIKNIANEFEIEQVVDKKTVDNLIKDALNEFSNEVDRFKRQGWRRAFKDWKTQSVATTCGLVASYVAGGPTAALALGSGAAAITLINHLAGSENPSLIKETMQYFSLINKRIRINEFTEGLLNYRKIVLGES